MGSRFRSQLSTPIQTSFPTFSFHGQCTLTPLRITTPCPILAPKARRILMRSDDGHQVRSTNNIDAKIQSAWIGVLRPLSYPEPVNPASRRTCDISSPPATHWQISQGTPCRSRYGSAADPIYQRSGSLHYLRSSGDRTTGSPRWLLLPSVPVQETVEWLSEIPQQTPQACT